jgi:hypothetical protein
MKKPENTIGRGFISIGFGWDRVQSDREDIRSDPCHGPEA